MRGYLHLLVFLFIGSAAAAQSVTVRSGEHGAFTRLVFDLPVGMDWQLTPDREARSLSLTFSEDGLAYDLSRVFDRIDRSRISNIEAAQDTGGVEISLACNCVGEAFALRDRMLVLDIRADPSGEEAPSASANSVDDQPLARDLARVRIDGTPGIGPRKQANALLPSLPAHVSTSPQDRESEPGSQDAPDALAIGEQIAAGLAAAATQGLLDPSVNFPRTDPARPEPVAQSEAKTYASTNSGSLPRDLAAGLSAMDDGMASGRIQIGGADCVADESLALARWVDAQDDINQVLAARRGAVFGEFDRIDEKAQIDLAKAFLHFGFGAEARNVLQLNSDSDHATLVALSFLVDREADPTDHFLGQTGCEGAAALWSVLALPQDKSAPYIDHAAVLRSFESLPTNLREHLGPDLAKKLSDVGHPDQARDVLRRLERSAGEETPSISLGKAQLALKDGDLGEAKDRLHTLSVEGGPESRDAVVASIELAEASSKPVPERIVDLAEAFAVEYRNSDEGPMMWKAHTRSLIVNGAFDQAFANLEEMSPEDLPRNMWQDIRDRAILKLTEQADKLDFLKIAMRETMTGDHRPPDATIVKVAERFLSLGLPEAAMTQLGFLRDPAAAVGARIVQARALLAMSQPEEAEIILIGQQGEEAVRLRAEARRQMGDHVFAQSIYEDLGAADDARESAWLSNDWQYVANSEEDALSRTAVLVQEEQVALNPASPTLSGAEELSRESAEARETLRSLLEATRIDPLN